MVHAGAPYNAGTLAYLHSSGNLIFKGNRCFRQHLRPQLKKDFEQIKGSELKMRSIWTMGEMIVEIMRPRVDMPLDTAGEFLGPYPSGAPAIFADTVAKMGKKSGIIGGVGNDDFGKCLLER